MNQSTLKNVLDETQQLAQKAQDAIEMQNEILSGLQAVLDDYLETIALIEKELNNGKRK